MSPVHDSARPRGVPPDGDAISTACTLPPASRRRSGAVPASPVGRGTPTRVRSAPAARCARTSSRRSTCRMWSVVRTTTTSGAVVRTASRWAARADASREGRLEATGRPLSTGRKCGRRSSRRSRALARTWDRSVAQVRGAATWMVVAPELASAARARSRKRYLPANGVSAGSSAKPTPASGGSPPATRSPTIRPSIPPPFQGPARMPENAAGARAGLHSRISIEWQDTNHAVRPTAYGTRRIATGTLLVCHLAGADDLQVGDQFADRGPGVTRIPAQLTLQLEPPAVAQRPVAKLQVGALHVTPPREQALDLGEGEQSDPLLGEIVGHRQQARQQPHMVAGDLLGQARVCPHREQAERRLELAQCGLHLTTVEMRVAPGAAGEAAAETPAFEPGQGGSGQRACEERQQHDDQRERDRDQDQRGEHVGRLRM